MRKLLDDRSITLAVVLYALAVAVWPLIAGAPVTVEDGFYYFKIAQNVVQGAGSSFDGEHPTNGYHPLWLLCLLPIFAITSTPAQALALGKVAQAVMAAAAAGWLYRGARIVTGRTGAVFAVLLWTGLTHHFWLGGLEFALHSLALAATLHVYLRWFGAAPDGAAASAGGSFLALGLGCAVTFLTRLDALLLAAILGAALFLSARRTATHLAVFAAPVAVAALAYAAVNLHLFGHALPVSAAVQRAWSQTLLHQQPFYLEHGWWLEKLWSALRPLAVGWHVPRLRSLALGVPLICAVLALGGTARRWPASRSWLGPLRPLQPWAWYGLLSYLAYVVTYHRGLALAPRYYAIQPILAALILGVAFDRLGDRLAGAGREGVVRLARAVSVALLMALTAQGASAWIAAETAGVGNPLRNAARWVARNLPEDARIASWNPGTIAYLSDRQVVNLDGLVNSWEFFDEGRHDVCGYWRETGINHVVDLFRHAESPGRILPMAPVPIEVDCPEALELLWRDARYHPDWSVAAHRVFPERLQRQR